jgi:hypothetical protein
MSLRGYWDDTVRYPPAPLSRESTPTSIGVISISGTLLLALDVMGTSMLALFDFFFVDSQAEAWIIWKMEEPADGNGRILEHSMCPRRWVIPLHRLGILQ